MVRPYERNAAIRAGLSLVLVALLIFARTDATAQTPEFTVDAVAARTNEKSDKTRLDLYTKIPYAALSFRTTAEGFTASYGVTAEIHVLSRSGESSNLVQTRSWDQSVSVKEFARTRSDQLFDRTIQTVELSPGDYLIEFRFEDELSKKRIVRELSVQVRDLSNSLAISDLILIDSYDPQANSITPTVGSRIGSGEKNFKLFYEIYADEGRSVLITREVFRVRKSNGPPSVKALLGFGRSEDVSNAEVTYEENAPGKLRRGRNQYVVEIPLEDFKVGEYVARVTVHDESGRVLDSAEKVLALQWTGLAEHVRNLDQAIAQLTYIAKKKDIDYIKAGRTEQERMVRFREFWNRRDPTPGTDRNERMEEYYYRIAYANRQYGSFSDGWRTDRGQVMVLFGEPDHIDRHPFNFDSKPYEVWYYNQIGRRFIFIDKTGLGDYELLVPYWDERTRIR